MLSCFIAMFFGPLDAWDWMPPRRLTASGALRRAEAAVLLADPPLTRFLARHYRLRLRVEVLEQRLDAVTEDEAAWLEAEAGAAALRRRARLTLHGKPMIEAESVLPFGMLAADLVAALERGEAPLGELFAARGLVADPAALAVARIGRGPWRGRWARRSRLRAAGGAEALVVEVFAPALWRRLEQAK